MNLAFNRSVLGKVETAGSGSCARIGISTGEPAEDRTFEIDEITDDNPDKVTEPAQTVEFRSGRPQTTRARHRKRVNVDV